MSEELDIYNRDQVEKIVCAFIKNKRLSKDQKSKIYNLLRTDIVANSIPDSHYSRIEKETTFDFSIQLDKVSNEVLFDILNVVEYKA